MTPIITMRRALEDPALIGQIIAGPSWIAWRVLLIAAMGEALTDEEREVFRRFTGRGHEPGMQVDELFAIVGRRGGKSRAIAVLVVYVATCVDHSSSLSIGERGLALIIAENQKQAAVVFGYVDGIFAAVPMFEELVVDRNVLLLRLANGIDVEVRAADYRGLRGPTYIIVVCDEWAFVAAVGAVNSDTEILNAVRPALSTTGGLLAVISSPYSKRGEVYETFKAHYGEGGDPRVLVARGASRDFNPSLPQGVVDRAMKRDPVAAKAEYGGEFRSDVDGYVDVEMIRAAVDRGVVVRPARPGVTYKSLTDVSGGVKDSFSNAIAHAENGKIVLDCLVEIRAPFNPKTATKHVAETLKSYGLRKTVGDRYAAGWVVSEFADNGITFEHSERDRSAIYLDCLPLFTAGRARLLDNDRLVEQFAGLERRTSPIGKDRVDHIRTGADDLSNAAAGAMVLAAERAAVMPKISNEIIARAHEWSARRARRR